MSESIDTSSKRKARPMIEYGGAADSAPYQIKRGFCARANLRDEFRLIAGDPSILHYMNARTLRVKLLEASRLIIAMKGGSK